MLHNQKKISKTENKAKQIIQKKAQGIKEKIIILSELRDNIKLSNILLIGV